jgi:hypothetical protein
VKHSETVGGSLWLVEENFVKTKLSYCSTGNFFFQKNMGNDASKKKPESPNTTPDDILNDKFSEFERISHPSTPENNKVEPETTQKTTSFPIDEMSYSGILVDKSGSIMIPDESISAETTTAIASPPPQGSIQTIPNRRRILKATPPPTAGPTTASVMTTAAKRNKEDNDDDDGDKNIHHGSGKQHLPAVLSPKASSELLKDSIEQSKTKRLEQLSREQKSKRDKLLEAKRRGLKTGSDGSGGDGSNDDEQGGTKKKKEPPQPNPFSKFLRVFSVEPTYPHHKRSYEEGAIDREEAVTTEKIGIPASTATGGRHSPSVVIAAHNESKRQKLDDAQHDQNSLSDKGKAILSSWMESMPEWVPVVTASAAMAVVAVFVALKISKSY